MSRARRLFSRRSARGHPAESRIGKRSRMIVSEPGIAGTESEAGKGRGSDSGIVVWNLAGCSCPETCRDPAGGPKTAHH